MDSRNVRVMKAYECADQKSLHIFIDEEAKKTLMTDWEGEILIKGRQDVKAIIKPLESFDQNAYVARITPALKEQLMVDYGENLLLYKIEE